MNTISLFVFSCTSSPLDSATNAPFSIEEQSHINFMLIAPSEPIESDNSNAYRYNSSAISFGEILFSDTSLSKDGDLSCGSCHQKENHFTDSLAQSSGLETTKRSAPTLFGLQRQRWFNWDGACDSAWCQAIGPLENDGEMGTSRVALAHVIYENHKEDYESIFGDMPIDIPQWPIVGKPQMDAWEEIPEAIQFESTKILVNIAKSIDAYEYTLTPPKRRFDDFLDMYRTDHQLAYDSLSDIEKHGFDLFLNEGRCVLCHSGSTLSNGEFHNIGLGERTWLDPLDIGRYEGIDLLRENVFNSAGIWSDDQDGIKAKRISRLNQNTEQLAQFKTPTLREISHTAPYMHGGHFETLDQVLHYYSNLEEEEEPVHGHRDETLQKQDWDSHDIDALIAFLRMASE
jgi:cytochrome c peroxidase